MYQLRDFEGFLNVFHGLICPEVITLPIWEVTFVIIFSYIFQSISKKLNKLFQSIQSTYKTDIDFYQYTLEAPSPKVLPLSKS